MKFFYVLLLVVVLAVPYGIHKFGFFQAPDNKENSVAVQLSPSTVFFDEAGQKMTLDAFKGKYVLINLWATWCPPCVVELPSLDNLQAKLKDKNFQVVAISMDRSDMATIMSFLQKRGIERLQPYWDKERQISMQWKYDGLPVSFLVDPDGNVLKSYEGSSTWDKGPLLDEITSYLK